MTFNPFSPRSSPAGESTGAAAGQQCLRRAFFNTDGGEPSDLLMRALWLAEGTPPTFLRSAAPPMDAILFFLNVTGITDITLVEDAQGRRLRASGRLTHRPVIDLKLGAA